MPVIKVWCLPQTEESKLIELYQRIVSAVLSVEELGLKGEKDVTCLFPTDMMKWGLGDEIIIEVTGLFNTPERTYDVRECLAKRLGEVVVDLFPDTELVECFIHLFDPFKGGFWKSDK